MPGDGGVTTATPTRPMPVERRRSAATALAWAAGMIVLPVAAVEGAARAGYPLANVRPVLLLVVAGVAATGRAAASLLAVVATVGYAWYYDAAGHGARSPFGPGTRTAVFAACAAGIAGVVLGLGARARSRSVRELSTSVHRERRDSASRLAAGEELNRAVLSSLPAHIAVLDAGGTIVTTNDAWERFARENCAGPAVAKSDVGINYLEVCRRAGGGEARQAKEVADGIEAVLQGERTEFRLEYPCHAPDRQRWFLLTATPLAAAVGPGDGASADGDGKADETARGPRGAVVSHFDITERKLYEESMKRRAAELTLMARRLQKSNDELDQFAYITSHDLRAPLRGIANLSQWIEEDMGASFTPEAHRQMELLRGRVHRMEAMIDGILEYSRVGRVRQKVERVDVAALLAEIIDLLDVPAAFAVDVAAGMPVIWSDRLRLQQVFMNLIGNAIKHHDRPQGRVAVSWREAPAEEGRPEQPMVEFAVADDGPGIEAQYHEKVFMIFQTLEARDKIEGTGIGLSLVRKIVESQGGSITLESEKGKGTTFRFTWPRSVAPTPDAAGAAARPADPAPAAREPGRV